MLVHRHAIKGTKTATAPSRGFRHPREGILAKTAGESRIGLPSRRLWKPSLRSAQALREGAVRSLKGGTGF